MTLFSGGSGNVVAEPHVELFPDHFSHQMLEFLSGKRLLTLGFAEFVIPVESVSHRDLSCWFLHDGSFHEELVGRLLIGLDEFPVKEPALNYISLKNERILPRRILIVLSLKAMINPPNC
jgi:hypothetical protein